MGGINAEYMGIVLSAFITTTCSKLLLWFVLLLMPRLRPRPIQLFSMELTAMLVMLPHTLTAMLDIHMPTPPSPDTAPPTELTPLESTDSPPLLSQLLPEDTPLPEDTSPTLPESSMLPRERLRLMPMLMLSTDTTDMPDLMLTVLDTEATDMDTHMPMVVSTERDPLMLSQRPRLMLLSSTEPTIRTRIRRILCLWCLPICLRSLPICLWCLLRKVRICQTLCLRSWIRQIRIWIPIWLWICLGKVNYFS